MWYPSCLGESIDSLSYTFIDVSIVWFFLDILFFNRFLWYHRFLYHDIFFRVHLLGMNVVLHVHTLVLKVVLFLFYGTTSVLSQCIIFHTSLCLPCIYNLALISGVNHSIFPNILPQNHRLPKWSWLVYFYVSIVPGFCLRVGGHTALDVLLGRHVISVLLGGVHRFP